VSVATTAPAPASAQAEVSPQEVCPLCGAPLKPEQSWCLRCGAAARTRLAAQPNWKALVVALLVVVVLSLGVLAAALVKLAG
jgi:predicted nucleic acid-binding Zn ribbon protein